MTRKTAKPNGQKVFVYRNLHKKCFSVKDVKTGLVIAHVDDIFLTNCEFRVSEAGRKRVLREKRKNVHAGVVGFWTGNQGPRLSTAVSYNPYKYESFVRIKDESAIYRAKKVVISSSGMKVKEI